MFSLLEALVPDADHWSLRGQCSTDVEMVPGPVGDGAYFEDGIEVLDAKNVCHGCPVKADCLKAAGSNGGVWGGLTLTERTRLRVSTHRKAGREPNPREVVTCSVCGLDCVPADRDLFKCDTCISARERPRSPEPHKGAIIKLIADGWSYGRIAQELDLKEEAVGKACRRWGTLSLKAQEQAAKSATEATVIQFPVAQQPKLVERAA